MLLLLLFLLLLLLLLHLLLPMHAHAMKSPQRHTPPTVQSNALVHYMEGGVVSLRLEVSHLAPPPQPLLLLLPHRVHSSHRPSQAGRPRVARVRDRDRQQLGIATKFRTRTHTWWGCCQWGWRPVVRSHHQGPLRQTARHALTDR